MNDINKTKAEAEAKVEAKAKTEAEAKTEAKAKTEAEAEAEAEAKTEASSQNKEQASACIKPLNEQKAAEAKTDKKKDNMPYFARIISKTHPLQKIILILFACGVFGYCYKYNVWHRNELAFFVAAFSMVFIYIDVLVIRDHLWVIEGSMRESKRWRDVFFSRSSLARQRLKKFAVLVLSAVVFGYLYHREVSADFPQESNLAFFVGAMLMITALYYEVLLIRDDVQAILHSVSEKESGAVPAVNKDIAQFLPPDGSEAAEKAIAQLNDTKPKADSDANADAKANTNTNANI